MAVPAIRSKRTIASKLAGRTGLAAAASLVAVAGTCEAASAATTTTTRAASADLLGAALKHSLAAAKKAGSARITVQFFSGSTTGKVLQDSSLSSGKQTVAIGSALASVLLTKGMAYISGNSRGLTSYFGLPTALVSNVIGHWISVPGTDPTFGTIVSNVALPTALANVTPTGTLTAGKRVKIHGQWARSISDTLAGGRGRLTLFVGVDAHSLPLEAVESTGSGPTRNGEIVDFSRWGETFQVTVPSHAIPIADVQAASSSTSG